MTVSETPLMVQPDPVEGASSADLASSLGVVGYAMFAWLQQGALSQIKPMSEVVEAFRQIVAAEESQRAAEVAQRAAAAAAVTQAASPASGFVDYVPVSAPVTAPITAAAGDDQVDDVAPPVQPAASSDTGMDAVAAAEPEVPPVPEAAAFDSSPESTPAPSLAVLRDISFLDD